MNPSLNPPSAAERDLPSCSVQPSDSGRRTTPAGTEPAAQRAAAPDPTDAGAIEYASWFAVDHD